MFNIEKLGRGDKLKNKKEKIVQYSTSHIPLLRHRMITLPFNSGISQLPCPAVS